jgi:hypothetical protein
MEKESIDSQVALLDAKNRNLVDKQNHNYSKPERIILSHHPELSERWVQRLIASDSSILNLGDLVLRDRERIQPRAGRLDLLLQAVETERRYEVQLQLGPTDEAHLIRTIEYWDTERKRYPQYDHCAVLIAEDITSRFLNVISLFNVTIPLIAIQMQALKVGEHVTLVFTTVVDEFSRGFVYENEDAETAPTDRAHWESKGSQLTVGLADELLGLMRKFDPALSLRYSKFDIGLDKDGSALNFVSFEPKKNYIKVDIRLPQAAEIDAKIKNGGLESWEYDERWGKYRIKLTRDAISKKQQLIEELMKLAYDGRFS